MKSLLHDAEGWRWFGCTGEEESSGRQDLQDLVARVSISEETLG